MKLHAIQTGSVRIRTAQVEGRGRGLRRRLAIFADTNWTDWLPTYACIIDHPEGVIVVDTAGWPILGDTPRVGIVTRVRKLFHIRFPKYSIDNTYPHS